MSKSTDSHGNVLLMLVLLTFAFTVIALIVINENTNFLSKSDKEFYLNRIWYINRDRNSIKGDQVSNGPSHSIWNIENTLASEDLNEDDDCKELDQLTSKNTMRNKLVGKFNYNLPIISNPSQLLVKWKNDQMLSPCKDINFDDCIEHFSWSAQIPLQAKRPRLISDKVIKETVTESLFSTSDISTTESDWIWTERMKSWKRVRFLLSSEFDNVNSNLFN